MTTEQRRALANTTPTTDVIRDAVTYPRDRLGEPLDISAERFDAWLAQVKRDAARGALDGLVQAFQWGGWSDTLKRGSQPVDLMGNANRVTGWMRGYRDTHYPEDVTP